MGAVNVRTGNSIYFDSLESQASRSSTSWRAARCRPAFRPSMIDGEHYWDGGDRIQLAALVRAGRLPGRERADRAGRSLQRPEASCRQSRPGARAPQGYPLLEQDALQHEARAGGREPAACARPSDAEDAGRAARGPDYKLLRPAVEKQRCITIAHLINRRLSHSTNSKDYEFSRATVRQLWEAGLEDVRRACAHREWLEATEVLPGVRVYDLTASSHP